MVTTAKQLFHPAAAFDKPAGESGTGLPPANTLGTYNPWRWSLTGNAGRSGREVSPQLRPLVHAASRRRSGSTSPRRSMSGSTQPGPSFTAEGLAVALLVAHRPALRHLRPETGPFGRIHVVVARRDCAIGRLLASARDGGQLCETSAVPGANRGRVVPSRPLDP